MAEFGRADGEVPSGMSGGGGADFGPPTGGATDFGQAGGFSGHGSGAWMHEHHHQHHLSGLQQHQLMHANAMRRRRSGPTSPAGLVVFGLVAIVFLVIFASMANRMDDGMPGFPPGSVVEEPGFGGGDLEIPAP